MANLLEARASAGIIGTGSYLPAKAVTNQTIADWAGVTEEWIVRKTGIHTRWYAADDEATSDLASQAARAAMAAARISANELGWIIVATATPDFPQPATACVVQSQIGASRAAAFDINAVCSGFVFALVVAAQLVTSGTARSCEYALVIGADVFSRIIDRNDRRTAALFGDGAGAVVLGPVPAEMGILGSYLATYGEHYAMIRVEACGSRTPPTENTLATGQHSFRMDGRGVREFVLAELPETVRRLLATHAINAASIDHVIPHQANDVMLKEVLPRLQLPRARMHLTVAEHGNTSAASIPLALDVACRNGAFIDGQLLLLAGFGGGMSVGTALVRWTGTPKNCVSRPGADGGLPDLGSRVVT